METDLTTYLTDIAKNENFPQYIRDLALKSLQQWKRNVIPDPNNLKKLSKFIQPLPPCSRPKQDGSCSWLRQYGEGNNLAVPPLGERTYCCFRATQFNCPGYKKVKIK